MPRFYFHVHDGEKAILDLRSIELSDTAAVREEALATARELMSQGMLAGQDRTGWRFEISDETGAPLLMVLFSDALRDGNAG